MVPTEIILTLENGETFSHRGPALKFFNDGLAQIRAGRGQILSAVKDTVKAEGCGHLAELLKALM